jgi:hypothetical protein
MKLQTRPPTLRTTATELFCLFCFALAVVAALSAVLLFVFDFA